MTSRPGTRLGWLGPALLAIGVAAAGVGAWFMLRSRPAPGSVVDLVAIDREFAVVVRAVAGGDQAFIQLVHADRGPVWGALVPRYAGRPGAPAIAWADNAIGVRVIRGGEHELWALSTIDAKKLGQLSLAAYAPGGATAHVSRAVTASDGRRGFEVVDGRAGSRLIAIDLARGEVIWQADLGPGPIASVAASGGRVVVVDDGGARWFDGASGDPEEAPAVAPPAWACPPDPEWSGSLAPLPYHCAGTYRWRASGSRVEVLDTQTNRLVSTLALE